MDDEGKPIGPPYQLIDNEFTLFDKTDLVFIDPVSTGYSRTVPKEKPDQFHTVKKDIESVGEFIRIWTTRNKRWTSPKFLIGESYGTTRAAGLAGYLHQRHGMYLNGIMLISSILNFITARFDEGNDLPYVLFLPSYTATAWYHKKLPSDLQANLEKAVQESREFAVNAYTLALMKGNDLSNNEKDIIIKKLARLTGLSEAYIEGTHLRINIHRFCKELLRDQGVTIGRLDSRYKGFDKDNVGEVHEIDPSYAAILGPYTATMYDYLRSELKYETDLPYEILKSLYQSWKFENYQNHYVNTAKDLREGFQLHPDLKVIVCNGYFDLATPFLATEYTFSHIPLPEAQQNNIKMTYYESGHMMYLHKTSLKKVSEDLHGFIDSAS
jgi:carboxypeptidase C (cathepsin A)